MEKLLNSIPKDTKYKTQKGEIIHQGVCLRYSANRDKWLCGYGFNLKKSNINKHYVEANDPVEALADFVDLLKNKKQ